jgi:hypothetical protein
MPVQTLIQVRQGPATGTGSWATANPALSVGEFGYDTTNNLLKIGNGGTLWNSLVAIGANADQLTTGTVVVARGGTGVNTFTAGVLYSTGGTSSIGTLSYSATPTASNNLVLTGTNGLITAGTGGFSTSGSITGGSISTSGSISGGAITGTSLIGGSGSGGTLGTLRLYSTPNAGASTRISSGTGIANGTTIDLTLPTTGGTLALTTSNLGPITGTANTAPIRLNTGTLLTSPAQGALEFDGYVFYGTAGTGRGYIPTENFISSTADHTLTSNTLTQPLFYSDNAGVGSTTGAVLGVSSSTTYFFECMLYITGMSATSGNLSFDLLNSTGSGTTVGTATIGSVSYYSTGVDASTITSAAAAGGSLNITPKSVGNISSAATGTAYAALITGILRVSLSGSIVPSIALTTASAAVIKTNTWFRIRPIGTDTVNYVGPWSA